VSKEKLAKVFPNAIGVQLNDDVKHVFGSFILREVAFQLMQGMVEKISSLEDDKVDGISKSSKEYSSSSSSEAPDQFASNLKIEDESGHEEPLINQITDANEVDEPQSSTIIFIGIALALILGAFSIYLLFKINSIENRRSLGSVRNHFTIDEAEQVLNKNFKTVQNLRDKLEKLQATLETSFSDKINKEL
jgi:hypothetical protein